MDYRDRDMVYVRSAAEMEEERRRIKNQNVLPCAETMPMLLWVLLALTQIQMRRWIPGQACPGIQALIPDLAA